MKKVLFAFAGAVILGLLALHGYAWQNIKPLTEANLVDLLKNDVSPERVGELATRKGIDFEMTPRAERTLRQAGANAALIAKLRSLSPKAAPPKLPAPTSQRESPAKPRAVRAGINPKDGQRYVWIPPGSFLMGCSPGDSECADDEKPPHRVKLTKGFWIGQTAVTAGAWKRYRSATATDALPAEGYGGKTYNKAGEENMPAVSMTWFEAKSYCEWASMRLPTEAEWEYAARAGTTAARYGGLDSIAWYSGNSGNSLHGVGLKQPNAWKLYDMLGNAYAWTADWYDAGYYAVSETDDPPGPPGGQFRVARGGSWGNFPQIVRLSYRGGVGPGGRYYYVGCRCAGELP